jgi:hypothetical protein
MSYNNILVCGVLTLFAACGTYPITELIFKHCGGEAPHILNLGTKWK